MSEERSFGLQWRLALISLIAGAAGASVALAVYYIALFNGLDRSVALILGLLGGVLLGCCAAIITSFLTRSFKLRLWEAGRMAGSIARGDYQARLNEGPADDVGWLEKQLNQMAAQLEKAVTSLRELAEQNKILAEEAGRGAALEERMRLARDLHDTVNQQLFVLSMRAAGLRRKMEKPMPDHSELLPEIDQLELLSRQAHGQIRELILQLRPIALDQEGLGAALRDYLVNTGDREGWLISGKIDVSINPDKEVGECFFRIAQEALNNISKHAGASEVSIDLYREGPKVIMVIIDNGAGFNLTEAVRHRGVGLPGIKERATAIGASAEIISEPGQGTTIRVEAVQKSVKEDAQ